MTTENISVTQADTSESGPQPAAAASPPASSPSQTPHQRPESNDGTNDATDEEPATGMPTPPVVAEAPKPVQPSADDAPMGHDPSEAPPADAPSAAEQSQPPSDAAHDDPSATREPSGAEDADEPARDDEVVDPPAVHPQRRVQLSPTYSPDVAKPIPSLGRPTVPEQAGAAQSATVSPAPSPTPPAAEGNAPAEAPPQETDPPQEMEPAEQSEAAAAVHDDTAAAAEPPADVPVATPAAETPAATAETPPATSVAPDTSVEPVALPPRDEALDADIEAQLNAALSGSSGEAASVEMGDAIGETEGAIAADELDISKGARLDGTVQSIHGDDMFIDFGARMAGVLSRRQFGLRRQPMQGEAITVVVSRVDENEGLIHVNLPSGVSRVRGNWDEVSVDQTVECQVNQTNKGGLEVSVGSLRGFMPASQVELGYVADLSSYVGQKLRAQITEVNPKRRKLVLSRRKVLEVEREQTEQDFFQKVAPGQTYEGRVKTIKNYGAFVDIGGVDGLLHVGQISWGRIDHPKDVLTEGQTIEVKVLSVDTEKKKIGLGMRQLSQNPWKTAEEKFSSGKVAKGKVTRIENFGAFIELEPGIEGLVHISELDHKRIKSVNEVLRVGQEVDVQVLEVDPSRKRISLSLKALKEKPEDAPLADEPAPARRKSPQSLKGGIGEPTRGKLFGDPRQFGR